MVLAVVMECLFSATFLEKLCQTGDRPAAVIVAHAHESPFVPITSRMNLVQKSNRVDDLCHGMGIPLYRVYRWNEVPDVFLRQFAFIIVACFPRLLPIHQLEQFGAHVWNVHPSALPTLRGPDPLFYTARGDAPAAVTIHRIDAAFDTGPVLATIPVDVTEVHDERQYIRLHAQCAGELFGVLRTAPPAGTPQTAVETHAWAGVPLANDYTLDPNWTTARAQRFVAYTDLRGHPYWVPGAQAWVRAIGVSGTVPIPCVDGTLFGLAAAPR